VTVIEKLHLVTISRSEPVAARALSAEFGPEFCDPFRW